MQQNLLPAIIPQSRQHLDQMLDRSAGFCDAVQVDIVDGVYAPQTSWPYGTPGQVADMLSTTRFDAIDVELDLMIARPEETLDVWFATGARRIVVHVESSEDLDAVVVHGANHLYQLGLACGSSTDLSVLDPYVADIDFVQLMGISEIGAQGQSFDRRVIEQITQLRTQYPELLISIDGSVNAETLPLLVEAGADRFVAGSAIWAADDPAVAYRDLEARVRQIEHGY